MQPAPNTPDFMLFTGNANPVLAAEIAKNLGTHLGAVDVGRFSDGEVTVELKQNVRAREVFVVQSTCAPTNENLCIIAFSKRGSVLVFWIRTRDAAKCR